jgi:hypothetical protein
MACPITSVKGRSSRNSVGATSDGVVAGVGDIKAMFAQLSGDSDGDAD